MPEILEFIFASPWRFIGAAILLAIFAFWSPISININQGE